MELNDLKGIYVILPTPLTDEGRVDEKGLRSLVDACRAHAFKGIVVLGSNGEYPYLGFHEKKQVMSVAAEQAAGRITVIAGASAWGTDQAVAQARAAKEAGCDAVMSAVPAYFSLCLENVLLHLEAVSEEGGLPVFFYYFPEVTGLVLSADDIARVADLKGVVGMKLTATNYNLMKKVIDKTRKKDFEVFIGTSFLMKDCLEQGGAGVFCPLPLIAAKDSKELWEACMNKDRERSKKAQNKLLGAIPLFTGMDLPAKVAAAGFKALSRKPYTGPGSRNAATHALIKEALRLQGHPITGMVKRPYRSVSGAQSKLVEKTLRANGWL